MVLTRLERVRDLAGNDRSRPYVVTEADRDPFLAAVNRVDDRLSQHVDLQVWRLWTRVEEAVEERLADLLEAWWIAHHEEPT